MIQRLGGALVADKLREYRTFAASDLDWTLVRPRDDARLNTSSPVRQGFRVGLHGAH